MKTWRRNARLREVKQPFEINRTGKAGKTFSLVFVKGTEYETD